MPRYVSHKKANILRESGWLKDRPILPGDLVAWKEHDYACRVGHVQADTAPRFRAEITRVDREPCQSDALHDHIREQWSAVWAFIEKCHATWVPGESHGYRYDLGEIVNERGQTYHLTMVIQFFHAINPNCVKFQVETEDDGYLYQREWYSDWPYHWRVRAKGCNETEVLRVFDWTLPVDDAAARVVPIITTAEYRRIEAAIKAGRDFEWGGPTRIAPELAGPLHRRWRWDDIFIDGDGAVYYVLDGKYTTALEATVRLDESPVPENVLWAMAGDEETLFTWLQADYETWVAEREAAGEPVDDPFRGFHKMVRLGQYNGHAVYLHFQCSPLGGDTLRFVYVDDQANYEAYWDWSKNIDAFSARYGQDRKLRWRQQRLKVGRDTLDQSHFTDYDYNSGMWEGAFNPAIGPDELEGVYRLAGPNGEFWVTESELYTRYKALLTRREYSGLLHWEAEGNGYMARVEWAEIEVRYHIEPSGRRWTLRRDVQGNVTTLETNVTIKAAKLAATTDALQSFPYKWNSVENDR